MRISSLSVLACLLAAAGCSSGSIYSPGPGARAPAAAPAPVSRPASVLITLNSDQTAAVRAWFAPQNAQALGRGNGRGNRGLPPGIARNLERGQALPPGIARQYLPQDLIVGLPRLTGGLDYVVAAGKLLLVEAATQVVLQVLIDALDA